MWKYILKVKRNIHSRILYFIFIELSNHSSTQYANLRSLYVLINVDYEYVTYIFR